MDDHLGKRRARHLGRRSQHISHPGRMAEVTLHRDDRDKDSQLFFTLLNRESQLDQHLAPGILEVADVVRVMDHSHQVGFIVPNRKTCLKNGHNKKVISLNYFVSLALFQRF